MANLPLFIVLALNLLPLGFGAEYGKASFVFGDSLVDAGNNNYLVTLSKANFAPNGIDFGGPTGRYTNGKTIVDIIEQGIGLTGYSPPYLAPGTAGKAILRGVNYASGGGGILNKTGYFFGGRLNLDAQIDNFHNTKREIILLVGETAAEKIIKISLFSLTMGSNDFINNYLTPLLSTAERLLVTPESFVGSMISKYRLQLTRLYYLGARKIVVANVGPIGCIPYERDLNPSAGDGCAAFPNELAEMFNARLRNLVQELNANLEGAEFLYADVYHIVGDIVSNYSKLGFKNGDSACCRVAGKHGGLIPCLSAAKVCNDRSKYVFWDPFHPSEAANYIIARRLLDGDSADIWPINIRRLISTASP